MKERFYSLDVFRGAAVCLMIMVNNPGSWDHIYAPLDHSPWHGVTQTDTVFPFFLFAVGNALAFVMPSLEVAGPSVFSKKIIKRTILIFLIGLFLNWMPFVKWDDNHLVFKQWSYIDAEGHPASISILRSITAYCPGLLFCIGNYLFFENTRSIFSCLCNSFRILVFVRCR